MDKESLFASFTQHLIDEPGQFFLQYEQQEINEILPLFYGFYLVQLGVLDNYDLKSASTINHKVYVGKQHQTAHASSPQVEASFAELPFQSECIDVFFLPHTLEYCAQPRKTLSEIYNILIPGGKLIILGFNPLGMIGLSKIFQKNKLLLGKLHRLGKLKVILKSIGFTIELDKTFCFGSGTKQPKNVNRFAERIARSFLPFSGSLYLLVAEKKAIPLAPIKLKVFNKKLPVTRGFPEPTTSKGL